MPMEEGKWEELNKDCLVNVFGRVGMESLVLDIPFVCKSWYKATLDPLCWEQLIFPEMETWPLFINPRFSDPFISRLMDEFQFSGEFPATEFIKSVVKRSHRSAVKIVLPRCCTEESLIYVADECPGLKILVLPPDLHNEDLMFKLPNLVGNWKYLEQLELGSSINMPEILYQISIHCKNFVSLCVKRADIGEEDALAIVTLLPNMKYLFLKGGGLPRKNLKTILLGCKQLDHFDVRDCIGFEVDDEILKLASNINIFRYEGSSAVDPADEIIQRGLFMVMTGFEN